MKSGRSLGRDDVEIESRETVWQGFFRIDRYRVRHRLFAGGWGRTLTREVFERGHAAAVLPYDPVRDEVVLLEQFRVAALGSGAEPWLIEIVAGIIEPGETAEDVVRREALEEAGCRLAELVPIVDAFTTPGGSSERIAIFCGRIDGQAQGGIHGLATEGEDIRASVEPFTVAMDRLAAGEITNLIAVVALQWLALNRENLRRRWLTAPGSAT